MSVPTVYRSDDPSAPTLNGLVGSLVAVLRACLITGYGSKAAAGWTVAVEDVPNHTIIFRNHSNRLFRLQDNGIINRDTTSTFHTSPRGSQAALIGMETYTDINTPVQPYPRAIAGGDFHGGDTSITGFTSLSNGVTLRKSRSPNANTVPWIVVANNRACHLFTTVANINTNVLPFPYNSFRGVHSFGDIKSFNPGNANIPKAYVSGGSIGRTDVLAHGNSAGLLDSTFGGLGIISNEYMGLNTYMNKSLEVANKGVGCIIKGMYFPVLGGLCTPTVDLGDFMSYPSVGNFGVELQPLIICEDMNDVIRTHRTSLPYLAEVGTFPGLFGCMHTTSPATSQRIGDELSVVTQDGVNYLLISQNFYTAITNGRHTDLFAVQLSDWYL